VSSIDRRQATEPAVAPRTAGYTFTKPEGLLAHYTTAPAAFEHILPTGKLRLSPYRLMRDPVENKDILPSIAWRGDPADADRAIQEVYAQLRAARDRMRVLSFTHDADRRSEYSGFDCCWARPRMWEQYGDVHRGACLLFDRPALERSIRDAWPREHTFLRDVDYTREGIASSTIRTLIDERIFEGRELAQAVIEYVEVRHDAFFFLKSDDFATEYEYRVVLSAGDDNYAYIDYRDALIGVVLGERFPAWQRPAVVAACATFDVKLGRMHWEHGRPHVLSVGS
jgi:Protein of unknown function (DUF2971)